MAKRIELHPDWPWIKKYRIAPGVQVGNMVYVSGTVALDSQGNVVGVDDMAAQCRQVFENIRAVLAEAGATMDDVIKIRAYLTDMSNYAAYSRARAEAFPNIIPASTVIGTSELVFPELLVEVEAVAEIGSGP